MEEIQDLYNWLNFFVKEGYDEDVAEDLLNRQDWQAISNLRDKADWYANNPDAPTELDEIAASEGLT